MKKLKRNIPNIITISRIITSPIAAILFVSGNIQASIGLYVYGAISDFLDGLAARKLNAFTPLGKKLDPISDKLFALSLLMPSLILGNYLMIIPLVLEAEIAATTIAAEKSGVEIETERVGKYKTWFLFTSIILGLLATKFPVMYLPLAFSLAKTTKMQLQSKTAYENQYLNKLKNKEKSIPKKENPKTEQKKKSNIRQQIKSHLEEYSLYDTFPIESEYKSSPKQKIKRR